MRAVRRTPPVVWSVVGLYLVVLLAYSILVPPYRAPDEPHHVDLANYVAEETRYPEWDELDIDPGVQNSLAQAQFTTGPDPLEADEAPSKGSRPTFEDLVSDRETSLNHQPQHPPLYYVLAAGFERGAEVFVSDPSWDVEVWLYRLFSVLLVTPLPLVIWHVAQRLGLSRPVGVAATLVPLAIPQFTHIGSVVNNDSLMMLAFWLLTPVVVRVADGDLGWRVGALGGAITGAGLFTKGFTFVMPLWMSAALLVALYRGGRARLPSVVTTGAVYGAVAFGLGGWWWLRNLVLHGELAPSRYSEYAPEVDDVHVDLGSFVQTWASRTTRRFWGEFGWFQVSIPSLAIGVATVVVLAGLVVGCRRRDRVTSIPVGTRLLVAAPLLLLVLLQFALALRGQLRTGRLPGLQGRYWFGSLAALSVVVTVGFAAMVQRWRRLLPLGALVGVVAMQAIGMLTVLGYYWGPNGSSVVTRLRAVVAWAPLPGEVVLLGAAAGTIVLGAVAVQVLRMALRDDAVRDGDAAGPLPHVPVRDRLAPAGT